jgi:predicted permease
MRVLSRLFRRARYLLGHRALEHEMDEEMRMHLEMEIDERIRGGLSPHEARRTAYIDFGGVERFKEEARTSRGVRPIEDLVQDVRYAGRVLRKSPGFTTAAVSTLAIGIAATTVVFSVIEAVLFRPPPVPEPERLQIVAEVWTNGGRSLQTEMAQHMYAYSHYLALREVTGSVFTGLAGYRYGTVAIRFGGEARAVSSIAATANYFHVLGVRPALGRLFSDTADRTGTREPEAVISHELWQNALAGDSAILGKTLFVNSQQVTIVGVAPREFVGTMNGLVADVWVPVTGGSVAMFGRLRPSLTARQAVTTLSVIGRRLPPEQSWQAIKRMTLDPMIGPPAMSRGAVVGFGGMLFLTTAMVLLIAAANIAGMLLARAAHRRREIAMRLALGASRGRLVRQLVTESIVLCLAGGAAGILMATWMVRLVPTFQPPVGVRTLLDLQIDAIALLVSFGVALTAGIVAGLTPALQSTRFDLASGLRDVNVGLPGQPARLRSAFVVAQLAMSLVLLVTAGLFTRAFQRALLVDPGLDTKNVVAAEMDVGAHRYDRERGEAFYAQLTARLAARPEIASATLGKWTPLSFGYNGNGIELPDGSRVAVTWGVIDDRYLAAMRIPIVAGRGFDASHTAESTPVVIVNETMARRLWPGTSPLGQRIALEGKVEREVIGVVRDGKYRSLDEAPMAYAFFPLKQRYTPRIIVHARARSDMAAAIKALHEETAALDANIAVERAGPLADRLELLFLPQRVAAWVVGVFGVVGLGLAALGVYGVIAYTVAQRTREIGIRLALGAQGRDVVGVVLRQGVVVIGIGIAIGLPAAMGIARLASAFLYGIGAADPATFVTVPVLLACVALLASFVPARRAARVDPMVSLRAD